MKLKAQIDRALNALFDPDQKPDETEYKTEDYDIPTDHRWVSKQGYLRQQEFLLRMDVSKRRSKVKTATWRGSTE
jgi:hypothetical protein